MTINIALANEQEQRVSNSRAAVEIDLDTELYSGGYLEGLEEHWAQKLGVEIPTQF